MKKLDAYFSYTDPDDGEYTQTHNVEMIPDDWSQEKVSNYLDDYLNAFQDDVAARGGNDLDVEFQFYIDGKVAW